ncbi:T9SS type A sorting domain-containing protein [Niastella sp. OAS944]|uniref:T9SS type A sorting domain-containing protein n=1 Tax=Niastella sp. OAS944 TaxID=2664089 RepID=UPI00346FD85F|nr:hypothetical protein [Chitinophagaceae bacterium OAS944]
MKQLYLIISMNKKLLFALPLFFLFFISSVTAQTLDWSSSFSPTWADGAVSRTANNVSGSGVNVSVSITNSQAGTYQQVTNGVNAPAVNNNNGRSNFFLLAGSTDALEIDVDWTSNTAYVDVVYNFSQPIYHLVFRVGDIDKASATSTSYFDRVTVTGLNGAAAVLPKTITAVNPAGNYLTISGNSAYANTTSGVGGNAGTNSTANNSQQGTAEINFGAQGVTRVTVRYDNHPSALANPALQAIAIGNMSWSLTSLPVDLISFAAKVDDNNNTVLKWKVENQENFDRYEIEYSILDSIGFTTIGKVYSNNQSTGTYEFIHSNANSAGNTAYYHLKMIDRDGDYRYSHFIKIRQENHTNVTLQPTVLTKGEPIRISIPGSSINPHRIKIVNMAGQVIGTAIMNGTSWQLETSKWNSGAYFINIEGADIKKTFKVLVK